MIFLQKVIPYLLFAGIYRTDEKKQKKKKIYILSAHQLYLRFIRDESAVFSLI